MGPIARRSTRGYVLQAAATLAGSGSSESGAARRGAQSVSPRAHLVIVCWGFGSVPAESSPPGEARGGTGCKGAHHRSRYSPFRHWLKALSLPHCAPSLSPTRRPGSSPSSLLLLSTTSAAIQNTLPPGDQHRTAPNAHLTAPWPMELGWGVSGDNLSATFMPRLCVYGRLLAPPRRGAATGIGR